MIVNVLNLRLCRKVFVRREFSVAILVILAFFSEILGSFRKVFNRLIQTARVINLSLSRGVRAWFAKIARETECAKQSFFALGTRGKYGWLDDWWHVASGSRRIFIG